MSRWDTRTGRAGDRAMMLRSSPATGRPASPPRGVVLNVCGYRVASRSRPSTAFRTDLCTNTNTTHLWIKTQQCSLQWTDETVCQSVQKENLSNYLRKPNLVAWVSKVILTVLSMLCHCHAGSKMSIEVFAEKKPVCDPNDWPHRVFCVENDDLGRFEWYLANFEVVSAVRMIRNNELLLQSAGYLLCICAEPVF